ncbi:hypothetical protein LS69_008540, partial [Helicobacter sp. MIT 05-5294]
MKYLHSLNIGTKIMLGLAGILVICMLITTIITTNFLQTIQTEEANKMLVNAAKREANRVQGLFNEIYVATNASKHYVARDVQQGEQAILEQDIMDILNSNKWGSLGYIYIKDPRYSGERIINPKHRLPNGDFLVLAVNDSTTTKYQSRIVQANEIILGFSSLQKTLSTGESTIGRPLWRTIDGKEYFGMGINQAITNRDGAVIGVLGIFIDLQSITTMLQDPANSIYKGDFKGVYATDSTIAAHGRKDFLGKYLREVNQSPTMNDLKHAIENQIEGIFSYINSLGEMSYTAVANIHIGENTSVWTLIVSAPESSIYSSVTRLRTIITLANIAVIVVIMFAMFFFIRSQIVARLKSISTLLFGFFKYVRHEVHTPPTPLVFKSHDEFGIMAKEINQNIQNIQKGLEKDEIAIAQ